MQPEVSIAVEVNSEVSSGGVGREHHICYSGVKGQLNNMLETDLGE